MWEWTDVICLLFCWRFSYAIFLGGKIPMCISLWPWIDNKIHMCVRFVVLFFRTHFCVTHVFRHCVYVSVCVHEHWAIKLNQYRFCVSTLGIVCMCVLNSKAESLASDESRLYMVNVFICINWNCNCAARQQQWATNMNFKWLTNNNKKKKYINTGTSQTIYTKAYSPQSMFNVYLVDNRIW